MKLMGVKDCMIPYAQHQDISGSAQGLKSSSRELGNLKSSTARGPRQTLK